MVGFAVSHGHISRIRIDVYAERYSVLDAFGDVAKPIRIILIAQVITVAAANDGVIDARCLHLSPVYHPLGIAHVNALVGSFARAISPVEKIERVEYLIPVLIGRYAEKRYLAISTCALRAENLLAILVAPAVRNLTRRALGFRSVLS